MGEESIRKGKEISQIVFLDFDGVLRRESSPLYRLEDHLVRNFEEAVRVEEKARVVITSSWRHAFALNEIRRLFSDDIAGRIEGVTPTSHDFTEFYRHREVLAYLKRYHSLQMKWLAVDDDSGHYPAEAPILLVDPITGFDSIAAVELARRMKST